MNTKLLTGAIAGILLLSPLTYAQDPKRSSGKNSGARKAGMSEDTRQAIEFERAKDRAAARQARIEARRPHADQSANRVKEDRDTGRKVKDTRAPGARRDQ